jgi:fibronectin type 3 domain-containing protein
VTCVPRTLRRAAAIALALAVAQTGCAAWKLHAPSASDPAKTADADELLLVESPAAELPVPEHVHASNDGYRVVALRWEPVLRTEVAGYAVERATSPDAPFERIAVLRGRGTSAYVDGGGQEALDDGVVAYYRLRPFTRDGQLAAEASPIVVGGTAPLPDAPPALRAFSRQPREIPLAWRPAHSEVAAGYVVERSPSEDGPYEVVARIPGRFSTSYVDRELGNLRVLYYRVATLTPDETSGPPSDPVRAVTKPVPLPPLGLRLAESSLGRNVLVWDANVEADIAEYRLVRIRQGTRSKVITTVPADTRRAVDTDLSAGEGATYAVIAVDRDGLESRPSIPIQVESQDYELQAATGPAGVSLRWHARPDEFPQARVARSSWLGERDLGRTENGSFVDANVQPGRSYSYVVVLIRPDGSEAPPSDPLLVHVPEDGAFR